MLHQLENSLKESIYPVTANSFVFVLKKTELIYVRVNSLLSV